MSKYGSYVCAVCGDECEKTRPDEEAHEEARQIFPDFDPTDSATVCDDCWVNMGLDTALEWGIQIEEAK